MRCEDVQKQLGIDAQLSRLSDKIKTHLLDCPNCRRAQILYTGIEQELREQPTWQPSPGFVERVGLQGLASLDGTTAKPRVISWRFVGSAVASSLPSILLGLLAATFSLVVLLNQNALVTSCKQLIAALSKDILATAIPLAWTTAVLSLSFSAWLTKRALR